MAIKGLSDIRLPQINVSKKRFRTFEEATNDIIRLIYGGDDPNVLSRLKDIIGSSIAANGFSDKQFQRLKQIYPSFNNKDLIDQRVKQSQPEFEFSKNPDDFINSTITKLKQIDIGKLDQSERDSVKNIFEILQAQSGRTLEPFAGIVKQNGEVTNIVPGVVTPGVERKIGEVTIPGEVSKNIEDLNEAEREKLQRESESESFLASLPSQLEAQRRPLVEELRKQSQRTFTEDIAPQILEQLNIRGLATSGDLPVELARSGFAVRQGVEDVELNLIAQEAQFYKNAAYQNKIRQLTQSQQDLSGFLAQERQGALTEQQRQFTAGQSDIQRRFGEDTYRRQLESAFQAQQQRQRLNQQLQERQQRSGLFSQIGGGLGSLAGIGIGLALPGGGAIAPLIGSAIGSQTGSAIGGTLF